jgi:DNA-binding transcriptional LysR family regulator
MGVIEMDEKDCLILKNIFETKNLTKAAELLYITPPALTYRIQQLENEFGVSIITKNGRGIELTPEGRYLVNYAKKSLIELRKTKDYMLNMKSDVQGELRLGVSRVIAHYKLPPILKEFLNEYPKVEINVNTGVSGEIYELIQNEDIHMAIVRGNYRWSEQKCLIKEENVYIISKDKINLADLPNMPRINYKIQSDFSVQIKNWWTERFNEQPFISMELDTFETCKEMVKNGLGYAIIPEMFLSPEDQINLTLMVNKDGQVVTVKTWLLYRESSMQLTIVEKFVNHIKSLSINRI